MKKIDNNEEFEKNTLDMYNQSVREQIKIQSEIKELQIDFNKTQKMMVFFTLVLAVATLIMAAGTFYQAYQSKQLVEGTFSQVQQAQKLVDISSKQSLPRASIEISSQKMPYIKSGKETFLADYILLSVKDNLSYGNSIPSFDFIVPINISIKNTGDSSWNLEDLFYSFSCGRNENERLILEPYAKKDISSQKEIKMSYRVSLHYLTIPKSEEECKVRLTFNFDTFTKEKEVEIKIA